MNGRLGVAAWRWLFILDFIIGIPIILFGICCCPGKLAIVDAEKCWRTHLVPSQTNPKRKGSGG